jgi:hypothetical protein
LLETTEVPIFLEWVHEPFCNIQEEFGQVHGYAGFVAKAKVPGTKWRSLPIFYL